MADYPRLSYRNTIVLIARDRPRNKMLLGGLGAMGVGEMWFDNDTESNSKRFPNWETAEERSSQ